MRGIGIYLQIITNRHVYFFHSKYSLRLHLHPVINVGYNRDDARQQMYPIKAMS